MHHYQQGHATFAEFNLPDRVITLLPTYVHPVFHQNVFRVFKNEGGSFKIKPAVFFPIGLIFLFVPLASH